MPTGLAQNLSFIYLGEDKSASKTLVGIQSTGQRVTAAIGSSFAKLGGQIGGEFGGILTQVGSGVERFGQKSFTMGQKLEVAGGVATAAGIALLKLGSEEKQATDQLDQAIKSAGDTVEEFQHRIDKAVESGQNFDHSAEDTKAALTVLTEATGSTKKALSEMTLVENLAATKHISLADAAALVAKILSGSGARTLTQYGIHLDKSKDKTAAAEQALGELAKKLDGQANASVDNFGSQVDIVKTKVVDWVKEMSGPLGSALTATGPALAVVGLGLELYRGKQEAATLAAITATVATEAETVAQTELDVAMDANPIGLVAGALGLLAAVAGGIALTSLGQVTSATQNYTAAIEADNDALGVNVEKQAAKALSDDGALKAAQKLGISGQLVVDATLGKAGAQAKLNQELKNAQAAQDAYVKAEGTGGQKSPEILAIIRAKQASIDQLTVSYGTQAVAIKEQQSAQLLEQAALGKTKKAADGAASAFDRLASSSAAAAQYNVTHSGGVKVSTRATGGVVGPGETTLVGERGPEIVSLPSGSRVWPTGTGPAPSMSIGAGPSGSAGVPVVIKNYFTFTGPVWDKAGIAKTVQDAFVSADLGGMSLAPLKKALT